MKKVLLVICLLSVIFFGVYFLISSTADRDIIKYNGRVYSNITGADWLDEEEKSRNQKGDKLGEIKRTSKLALFLWDFSATKLPKGTVLFRTEDAKVGTPIIIVAEKENREVLFYRWLPKE